MLFQKAAGVTPFVYLCVKHNIVTNSLSSGNAVCDSKSQIHHRLCRFLLCRFATFDSNFIKSLNVRMMMFFLLTKNSPGAIFYIAGGASDDYAKVVF